MSTSTTAVEGLNVRHRVWSGDGRRRPTCPSTRSPSTIDLEHGRKRRRRAPRAARNDPPRRRCARCRSGTRWRSAARRGQQRPQEQRERLLRDGSTPPGPGPGQRVKEAVCGDRRVARDVMEREDGVDGRNRALWANCHVRGLCNGGGTRALVKVRVAIERVDIVLSAVCSSLAAPRGVGENLASKNGILCHYEG